MEQLLVRPEEGARVIDVSRATIYKMLSRGEIESVTIGRSRRIPAAALRSWVDARVREQKGGASEPNDGRSAS
ncbi:MAG: helix-turn-helix domain-containing protein [Chloroflexota bacterium]|nr:helix-turn-helix domain-containing protein [Chloroflexota bacterium]